MPITGLLAPGFPASGLHHVPIETLPRAWDLTGGVTSATCAPRARLNNPGRYHREATVTPPPPQLFFFQEPRRPGPGDPARSCLLGIRADPEIGPRSLHHPR